MIKYIEELSKTSLKTILDHMFNGKILVTEILESEDINKESRRGISKTLLIIKYWINKVSGFKDDIDTITSQEKENLNSFIKKFSKDVIVIEDSDDEEIKESKIPNQSVKITIKTTVGPKGKTQSEKMKDKSETSSDVSSSDSYMTPGSSSSSGSTSSSESLGEKKLSKDKVKEIVWDKYCPGSKSVGKCFVCGCLVNRHHNNHVEFGHVLAESKGGLYTVDNIRPICFQCNSGTEEKECGYIKGMHEMHMYEYIVRNNIQCGLANLLPEERKLYVYDKQELRKVFRECSEKLDSLMKAKKIDQARKDSLYSIIIKDDDPKDKIFQGVIALIQSL